MQDKQRILVVAAAIVVLAAILGFVIRSRDNGASAIARARWSEATSSRPCRPPAR